MLWTSMIGCPFSSKNCPIFNVEKKEFKLQINKKNIDRKVIHYSDVE